MKKVLLIIPVVVMILAGALACGSAEQKAETPKKLYAAIEVENRGTMWFELYPDKAPKVTAHFRKLADEGFYNGLLFWRVAEIEKGSEVVQSGCPNNDGTGHSDRLLKEEIDTTLHHVRGTLSMIRMGAPWTTSCQFLICRKECPDLDGKFTIIGKLIRGEEVLDAIEKGDTIKTITIKEE
jgi:peptidyl-prolyl cis-trans isomerase B (cyclophilin B)